MNKWLKIIPIVVLVALAGGILALANKPGAKPRSGVVVVSVSPKAGQPSDTPITSSSGSYVDYAPGIIAATRGTKVLFFHASWCPQCRKLEQSIREGTIPAGVVIIKVDYDSNQALRRQYGVTIQTTLVRVDDAGNLQQRYVAYDTPSLEALIKNILPQ